MFVSGLARLMCTASSTYSYDDEGDLMVSGLVLIAVTVIGLAAVRHRDDPLTGHG